MIETLRETFSLISTNLRFGVLRLQFVMIVAAISEVCGIAAIGPFMALASDPTLIESSLIYNSLYNFLSLETYAEFILIVGVIVIAILTVSAIISTFSVKFINYYAQLIGAELSSDLLESYLKSNWLFHTTRNSNELIANITGECSRLTSGIIIPFLNLNAKTIIAISIISFLFWIDFFITTIGIVLFALLYFLIFFIVKARLSIHSKEIRKTAVARYRAAGEGLGGIKDLLIYGRTNYYNKIFRENSREFAKAQGAASALGEIPKYWVEFCAFGVMITLVIFLSYGLESSFNTFLPKLAMFAMASYKLIPAFQQIYISASNIRVSKSALDIIGDDLKNNKFHIRADNHTSREFNDLSIKLTSVSFSYPDTDSLVLDNINLSLEQNLMYGFVGPSGSGKSSLVDIIMGLIIPTSGTLSIGGNHLKTFSSLKDWQRYIGYVPQSVYLVDNTIRKNIAFSIDDQDIDDSRIEEVIQIAQLSDFVASLPEGVNTLVGDKGVQLSGGQRQRISIARALYSKPSVLVLDEATSALDGPTEAKIMEAINSLSKFMTILIIAHRINTVKKCSNIFFLEDGKIIDEGNYEKLYESNQRFKDLSKLS